MRAHAYGRDHANSGDYHTFHQRSAKFGTEREGGRTERLPLGAAAQVGSGVRLDVVDCILDGANFLRLFIGDVDLECFLESEDELDQTQ